MVAGTGLDGLRGACAYSPQPDLRWAAVPVGGTVEVWKGDVNVGEVSIRVDGTFRMDIPGGEYTLKVITSDSTGLLVCEDAPVTIVAGATTEVHLSCDTGIR